MSTYRQAAAGPFGSLMDWTQFCCRRLQLEAHSEPCPMDLPDSLLCLTESVIRHISIGNRRCSANQTCMVLEDSRVEYGCNDFCTSRFLSRKTIDRQVGRQTDRQTLVSPTSEIWPSCVAIMPRLQPCRQLCQSYSVEESPVVVGNTRR